MKDPGKNIDKAFRDKLDDFREQPPLEIWEGIEAVLGSKPRRLILVPLWKVAAGAALVVAAGGIFYYLNRPEPLMITEQVQEMEQEVEQEMGEKGIQGSPVITGTTGERNANSAFRPVDSRASQQSNSYFAGNIPQDQDGAAETNDITAAGFSDRQEFAGLLNVHLMPDAFLAPARNNNIPRNKHTLTASWDMLSADISEFEEESRSEDRISLSAQVAPTYSYRDIGSFINGSPGDFNDYETGKISYGGGLQFGVKTSGRLSIHTGIMYAQLGYNVNQVESFYSNKAFEGADFITNPDKPAALYEINNSIGTLSSSIENTAIIASNSSRNTDNAGYPGGIQTDGLAGLNSSAGKLEQYFQYLEVPLLVRYRILDKKFGINLLGGLSTNILVGNSASLTSGNQVTDLGSSRNIKQINYLGNMGIGFDYALSKMLRLSVEPQFKYFLNSINEESLISNRPYILGMYTGIKFVW